MKEKRTVAQLIEDCITYTLAHAKGGYLCRVQEGEYKYMIAFETAAVRLGT